MAWHLAIPIAMAAVSALSGAMANKSQKKQAGAAASNAERAREESTASLQGGHIYGAADWMFPGLLDKQRTYNDPWYNPNSTFAGKDASGRPLPTTDPRQAIVDRFSGANNIFGKLANKVQAQRTPAPTPSLGPTPTPTPRAKGGPVKKGKPALVGERGAEAVMPHVRSRVSASDLKPAELLGYALGTGRKSHERLGALETTMFDETGQPRKNAGATYGSSYDRLVGYPTSTQSQYTNMQGLGQPVTSGANPVSDFLSFLAHIATRRAEGGPTEGGQPYMVGEQGPEVIVPKQDGMVVPNDQLPQGAGDMDSDEMSGEGEEGGESPSLEQVVPLVVALLLTALQKKGGEGAEEAPQGMPPGGMPSGGMPPGMPMRALGGPVAQGQPTIVGEKGPEQVTPMPTIDPRPPGTSPQFGATQATAGADNPSVPSTTSNVAPGGATGQMQYLSPGLNPQAPGVGESVVQNLQGMAANPGQLSPVAYERAQEQAQQGSNQLQMATTGRLSGSGIDPGSVLGQALQQSAAATGAKLRNEAARDYTVAQEQLRRSDIQNSLNQYISMLNTIFGLQQQRSAAAGGQSFPQITPTQSPYNAIGNFAGTLGTGLADYFAQRQTQQGLWNQLPQTTQQYGVITG